MLSEIIAGLAAANQAVGLVKELREIDRSVDEASFKLKLAELTQLLADAKIALSEANLALNERDSRIEFLKTELDEARNGETCPKCRVGRLRLTEVKAHHMHGLHHFGVEDWLFSCSQSECGFEQMRIHDPHGAVPAQAKKRS